MVPCRVALEDWEDSLRQHRGILFDRCRLVQYGVSVSEQNADQCRRWFAAAVLRERDNLRKRMGLTTGVAGRRRPR
jgi:hypothetical protein